MTNLSQYKIAGFKENFYDILTLSGQLLLHVKLKKDIGNIEQKLKIISSTDLLCQLHTDEEKKVFWINIYNAYYQILASKAQTKSKGIFSKKAILIAQNLFSLDNIEHGILRKYRCKKSLGYLPNPFASALIKKLAVKKIDYRIHFALNCGAKSCPPIAFYTLEKLDAQLNDAMYSFLISETSVDKINKTIATSKLLHWYRGDFGGTSGIKKVLQQIFSLQLNTYKLTFNEYNWETHLENYA